MKSLEKLQKLCGIFKVVTLIIAILSFVGVYLNVVVSAILLISGRFGIFAMLQRWLGNNGYTYGIMPFVSAPEIAPRLISNIISCAINGVLFISAMHCFSAELADGTPFSHRFADEIRTLGIKTIIFPIIGVIVSSIVYALNLLFQPFLILPMVFYLAIFHTSQSGRIHNFQKVWAEFLPLLFSLRFCPVRPLEVGLNYTPPCTIHIFRYRPFSKLCRA